MSSREPDAKTRDIWAKLGKTIRSGAETIVQETKGLTRIGRLKLELMSLENERGRKFEEIGRAAHTLHKTGTMSMPEDLHGLLESVDDIESSIEAKNEEIDRVRHENQTAREASQESAAEESGEEQPPLESEGPHLYCRQCGRRLAEGDVFCSRCGTQV